MSRIHKISLLIVLLLNSFAFAEDAKDKENKSYIKYESQQFRGMEGPLLPSRDIIIEGSNNVRDVANSGRKLSGLQNENLIYRVNVNTRQSYPGPAKDIKDIYLPMKNTVKYSIQLMQIPSTMDSEEIRQKYLDLAREDFEIKLRNYQVDKEKELTQQLKKDQESLSQLEKEIQESKQSKAAAEATIQKNQFKTDILAYLYKEKVKLDLDRLEQRAKLDAITQFYDRETAARKETSKIEDEIQKLRDELKSISDSSSSRAEETKNSIAKAEEKWRSIRESLSKNPEYATPKEQYVDVKISQIATEKRLQEVEKLISQYEQAEKTSADVVKINSRLEELGKKKDAELQSIKFIEGSLEDIKAHPVRVINKADYDAVQGKKAGSDGDVKENEETAK